MAKVMVVDDEPSVVTLMRFVLEKVGHSVVEAHNGEEALRMLGVTPKDETVALPDLILLDVMMPIVDGYTVAIQLKNDARASAVPVIVITAKSDMRGMFSALPNVKSFFNKPFDPKSLREAVAKAVLPQ